jgi:cell division protein FtsZ
VTVVATGLSRANARRQPMSVVQGGCAPAPTTWHPMVGRHGRWGHGFGMAAPAGGADYGNMAVPSVWRTNRTQAAARVDALVSGGMDDLEIPAFLRKQAD